MIDKEKEKEIINFLLKCVKEDVEKDLETGLYLIKNFNQYNVNNYMNDCASKYGIINILFLFFKYGPRINNNNLIMCDYSREDLNEQVLIVDAIRKTFEIKDGVDKYNSVKKIFDSYLMSLTSY